MVYDIYLKKQINLNRTNTLSLEIPLHDYPYLIVENPPILTANGAEVMDSETKKILYSKNANIRFSPASTTKITTAITGLEYFKPEDILTVKTSDMDSVVGIKPGQKFYFIDLLYAMMLPSDNRAAATIADNFPGGRQAFVDKMNQNVKDWNLKSTHFADPVGINDDLDYTTPHDLAFISSIAMQSKIIKKIANTRNAEIKDLDSQIYEIQNLNRLLDSDGVIGLKTGHTDEAGDVLATAKMEDGHLLIIVVMNSKNRFSDTLDIFNFIKDKISFLSIHP